MKRRRRKYESTAYREAGHAVAACVLRLKIGKRAVTILPALSEIIGGSWTILQNQPTKRRRSHRRPKATTDEQLRRSSELLRPAGPNRTTRCDLWWP